MSLLLLFQHTSGAAPAAPQTGWLVENIRSRPQAQKRTAEQVTTVFPQESLSFGWFVGIEQQAKPRRHSPSLEQVPFVPQPEAQNFGWQAEARLPRPRAARPAFSNQVAFVSPPQEAAFGWLTAPISQKRPTASARPPKETVASVYAPEVTAPLSFGWYMSFDSRPRLKQAATPSSRFSWIVTPEFIEPTPPGGTDRREVLLAKILAAKARKRDAQAKNAKARAMAEAEYEALVAKYAADDTHPFPLDIVLERMQADEDDMIMALLATM